MAGVHLIIIVTLCNLLTTLLQLIEICQYDAEYQEKCCLFYQKYQENSLPVVTALQHQNTDKFYESNAQCNHYTFINKRHMLFNIRQCLFQPFYKPA